MTKRTSLAAALHEAGARQPSAGAAMAAVPPTPVESTTEVSKRPPSRVGLRAVTAYVSPEVHRQLRLLGVDQNVSVQEMLVEAINDLFRKCGRLAIADSGRMQAP